MSNPLAIAAVTSTLRNLLNQVTMGLPDAVVTVKRPIKARSDSDRGNQVNLFLYQVTLNSAWQKKKPSSQVHPLPLALNLYYLITTFGKNDDDILGHRLLGQVMSILHDHSVLNSDELKVALPGSDLYQQLEQIRIVPHPLSLEDLSKLCNTFQGPYGVSVAYQVSVVLITRQVHSSTPVLPQPSLLNPPSAVDSVQLIPALPALTQAHLLHQQLSAKPGDIVTLQGYRLEGDRILVRFRSVTAKALECIVPPLESSPIQIRVQIPARPDQGDHWPIGLMTVAVMVTWVGEPEYATNAIPLALRPELIAIQGTNTLHPDLSQHNGHRLLTATCRPPVWPEQAAMLLLGRHAITAQPHGTPTTTLTFLSNPIPPGQYPVQLRVDGIDSLPMAQKVTVPLPQEASLP